jgi:hypothetical protein
MRHRATSGCIRGGFITTFSWHLTILSLSHSKSKISKIAGKLYEVFGPPQEKRESQLMVDLIFFCLIPILYFCGYASLERVSLLFECMSCLLSFLGGFLLAFYISSEKRPRTPSPTPCLPEVLLIMFYYYYTILEDVSSITQFSLILYVLFTL